MAKDKEQNQNDGAGVDAVALKSAFTDYLKNLPADELKGLLSAAGVVPTTMGMDAATLHVLMGSLTKVSADAQKEALRSQRKENPLYPERSAFNPRGVYDDEGNAQAPKLRFIRPTYFNHVRLGGELETEEEIALFNQFTESRYAREGTWKAEIEGQGVNQRLVVVVPSRTVDDRMGLPPLPLILRELLGGKEAVNPATLQKQIEAMQAEIEALKAKQPAGAAA